MYSIITSLFFSLLLYFRTDIVLAGLVLTVVIHILRSFTCANFKATLQTETQQSYLWILGVLMIIVFSVSFNNNQGVLDVPDKDNSKIIKEVSQNDFINSSKKE